MLSKRDFVKQIHSNIGSANFVHQLLVDIVAVLELIVQLVEFLDETFDLDGISIWAE